MLPSLSKVTKTFRKKLASPQDSCGREIPTARSGKKKAWWACGQALQTFEQDIQEDLDAALLNKGLGYADIYARLYMIGNRPETATPIIMICCTSQSVRSEAESSIRNSGMLKKYPEFGLGASSLPLEQRSPAVALGADGDADVQVPETAMSQLVERPYAATSQDPKLGRRIFTISQDGRLY
ncbi:hypothetical protein V8F33_009185 [Rhypophila sp. PSN 637]